MSDPYRDGGPREVVDAPRDRGIVGDVIAQFADPNAFYRELVQNAIDADSPDVTIELRYDASTQRMHAAVRDRGTGMTREVVENQLLVLFRSTKEHDSTKIGKFGIGFKSVLACDPELVVVSTVRDGKRLIVHLYRDLSYDLFDGGRATLSGTTVELQIAMQPDQRDSFYRASEQALRHWCRHASVPIHLEISDAAGERLLRIDSPLALEDAVLQVTRTFDNGELIVIAGLTDPPKPYLGFFNHGLTLVETTHAKFGKVAVKVQDSRLGHTLSREDVRRDEHYERAIEAIRETVVSDLANAAAQRLRELADAADDAAHGTLLTVLVDAHIAPAHWYVPLLRPRRNEKSIELRHGSGRVWAHTEVTPLTDALIGAGLTIVRRTCARDAFARVVALATGAELGDFMHELTAVAAVEYSEKDELLVSEMLALFDRVHREPLGVVLRNIVGAHGDRVCISIRAPDERLQRRDQALKNPFALFGRRILALSVRHPIVAAAREHDDPRLAASHVVRAVLVEFQLMNEQRSEKLLDHALDRLGVSA